MKSLTHQLPRLRFLDGARMLRTAVEVACNGMTKRGADQLIAHDADGYGRPRAYLRCEKAPAPVFLNWGRDIKSHIPQLALQPHGKVLSETPVVDEVQLGFRGVERFGPKRNPRSYILVVSPESAKTGRRNAKHGGNLPYSACGQSAKCRIPASTQAPSGSRT